MEVGRIQPAAKNLNQMKQSSQYSSKPKQEEKMNDEMEQKKNPSEKEVKKAVDGLNRMFELSNTHIKFNYHEKLGEYYVQVIDDQENEVIREIPSKKILDLVAHIRESIGILIDTRV
ncbi:flagellar protein FlaG [Ammoniphilus resinae]|uniref:Flagellar protein FlaG n=1 Tax=Ammoniphilus resinae TaxID=861532 RepID=A0ABS4GMN4_9BACL|nr:flagellar protein FlaG [Ammoniphilus resinae]MBP1931509.1 flagellar protein FlaG [Ammoniphilus resinae]